jgi:hypothetical protein
VRDGGTGQRCCGAVSHDSPRGTGKPATSSLAPYPTGAQARIFIVVR